MVEVHVDLDDDFDPRRAALPLGGLFSVRFPGRIPPSSVLRTPPPGLPSLGVSLEPTLTDEHSRTERPAAHDPDESRNGQLPRSAELQKMKVDELKAQLKKLRLPSCSGRKADLLARLLQAVAPTEADRGAMLSDQEEDDDQEWKVKMILRRTTDSHQYRGFAFI